MSYGKDIPGGTTKKFFQSLALVPSVIGSPYTLFTQNFDFSTLAVGEGYRILVDIDVAGGAAKQLRLSVGGTMVVNNIESSSVGGTLSFTVLKYDPNFCFYESFVDFNAAGNIPIAINSEGSQANTTFFGAATTVLVDCITTTSAGEFVLSKIRIETIKLN